MGKKTITKTNFSISMAYDILDKVNAECASLGLDRSSFITMAVNQYFKNQEAVSLLSQVQNLWEEIKTKQAEEQITFYDEGKRA